MNRILKISIWSAVLTILVGTLLFAQGPNLVGDSTEEDPKLIDLKADLWGPVADGDSVIFLVGNFAAQHNGAVITCDSAVRYSASRIEFFGNVLINQNTTYIYGDRAEYNGEENMARVYSELVKVIDGAATLYTYDFSFNTKSNIGYFNYGGVLQNNNNVLESQRGYYYANEKSVVGVDDVEMRNEEYVMSGDSVVYNMQTDHAQYFDNTNIWNKDGDYLYADRGEYHKADTLYKITENGYVLTPKQEIWADTIDYYRAKEFVRLKRNIQIDDKEHKSIGFGDYGEMWQKHNSAVLTLDPSVLNYDQEQADTLFMRADTMLMLTLKVGEDHGDGIPEEMLRSLEEQRMSMFVVTDSLTLDSLAQNQVVADILGAPQVGGISEMQTSVGELQPQVATQSSVDQTSGQSETSELRADSKDIDSQGADQQGEDQQEADLQSVNSQEVDSLGRAPQMHGDSLAQRPAPQIEGDSVLPPPVADSLSMLPINPRDTLSSEELKIFVRDSIKQAKDEARQIKLDSIGSRRVAERRERAILEQARADKRRDRMRELMRKRFEKIYLKAKAKGEEPQFNDSRLASKDTTILRDVRLRIDSITQMQEEIENRPDTLSMLSQDSVEVIIDSMYRLTKGYRDVKIYRKDMQSVSDSAVVNSTDSTIHMYILPVMWNGVNQITSEQMDIYTENNALSRAEFVGKPMMISELDTMHYNQVKGKEMVSYFRDNEVYKNDVNGNAETIYYIQDGNPPQVTMMMVIESGDITFHIQQKEVTQIVYRSDVNSVIYPISDIPADQSKFLQNFKWEESRRPTKADVFDRELKESKQEQVMSKRKPIFPISKQIEQFKVRMMEEGRWADRNDTVLPETVEWMRTLGYEVGQPRKSEEQPQMGPESQSLMEPRVEPVPQPQMEPQTKPTPQSQIEPQALEAR